MRVECVVSAESKCLDFYESFTVGRVVDNWDMCKLPC